MEATVIKASLAVMMALAVSAPIERGEPPVLDFGPPKPNRAEQERKRKRRKKKRAARKARR